MQAFERQGFRIIYADDEHRLCTYVRKDMDCYTIEVMAKDVVGNDAWYLVTELAKEEILIKIIDKLNS
jgi:hypothetical protein